MCHMCEKAGCSNGVLRASAMKMFDENSAFCPHYVSYDSLCCIVVSTHLIRIATGEKLVQAYLPYIFVRKCD